MATFRDHIHKYLQRVLVISTLVGSGPGYAYSLQEALQTAFYLNKRTTANKSRLAAAEDRAEAAWLRILPQINLYAANNKNKYSKVTEGALTLGDTKNTGYDYGVTVNIFRGGADYYSARAFDSAKKAQEAIYNSTNALIPNTKGAIANLVTVSFLSILAQNEALIALELARTRLLKIRTVTSDSGHLAEIERNLLAIKAMVEKTLSEKRSAEREYVFAVTLPPPPNLDSFEEVIASLIIPEDYDSAIVIAETSSPEIIASYYLLEEATNRRLAETGRLFYPSIDFSINRGRGRKYESGVLGSTTADTTYLLSLTWTLVPSIEKDLSAMNNHVAAVSADREAEFEKLKYELDSIYEAWKDSTLLLDQYIRNLEITDKAADQLMRDIDAGQTIDFVQAIKLLNDRNQTFSNVLQLKIHVAYSKFQIQKIIGTLFQATQMMYQNSLQMKSTKQ